jgi:WD40 repeat protein
MSTDQMCLAISADTKEALIGTVKAMTTSMTISRHFLDGPPEDPEPVPLVLPEDFSGSNGQWSNDGRWLIGTGTKQQIFCWDMQSKATTIEPAVVTGDQPNFARRISISPDSRWVAAHSGNQAYQSAPGAEELYLWDLSGGSFDRGRVAAGKIPAAVLDLAFSDDSRWLVVACSDQRVRFFDLRGKSFASPSCVAQLDNPAMALALAPNLQRFAVGDTTGHVRVWQWPADGKTPQVLADLEPQPGPISQLVFSPDGRWLLSDAVDNGVRLWDLADIDNPRFEALPLDTMRESLTMFSPDSRWLLMQGGVSVPVILWDLKSDHISTSGIRLFRRWLPYTEASLARFSPDSKFLLTGGMLTGVSTWPLEIEDLLGLAEMLAGRQLTDDERRQYRIQDPPEPMESK